MAYSKAKLKSSGDGASPCFRPFWIGKLSDNSVDIVKFALRTVIVAEFYPLIRKCDQSLGLEL
jgi:hypothetical protein